MGRLAMAIVLLVLGCGASTERANPAPAAAPEPSEALTMSREAMVTEQLERRGIRDARVLEAMRKVPRHVYAPKVEPERAYEDSPQPIGHKQTISQPYIVALMTELAKVDAKARVLEIGTGSGYQAAVLGELVAEVYSIEIVPELAAQAAAVLAQQGYSHVHVRAGDGYAGWPEQAPFDAIVVTAGAPRVPQALLDQLKVGGRLVIPVDQSESDWRYLGASQQLEVHVRTEDGFDRIAGIPVRFVPMTGEVRKK
jgi:protein-L-isoaspartate(D-aspartate) O-methyltransferase